MKHGILACRVGSRLSEGAFAQSQVLVEIESKQINWQIMRYSYEFGRVAFVISLVYRVDYIIRWVIDHVNLAADQTSKPAQGTDNSQGTTDPEDWTLNLLKTSARPNTDRRIKRLMPYFTARTFMLTWKDGVRNFDIEAFFIFHESHAMDRPVG